MARRGTRLDGVPGGFVDPALGVGRDVAGREHLRRAFEAFGFAQYEAQALVALLEVGSGTATQLARVAGVPRPAVYEALEGLVARGLAFSSPGKVTTWSSPGRDEVMSRVEAAYDERLAELAAEMRARATEARRVLSRMGPEAPVAPIPYVELLRAPGAARAAYDRLVAAASRELLVFNQPPYRGIVDVDPAVLDALGRNVQARAIYEAAEVDDPGAASTMEVFEAYHRAGVAGRVAVEVPIKLAVFDRQVVMFSLEAPDRTQTETGSDGVVVDHVVVDHVGFAVFAADAFERRWEMSVPYAEHRSGDGKATKRKVSARGTQTVAVLPKETGEFDEPGW